jgi:hypothetical protein
MGHPILRHSALGFACAVVAACAEAVWVKPGATTQDFNADSYACERDARQSAYFGGGLIGALNMQSFAEHCMVAHGWSKSATGTAASTPETSESPAHQQAVMDCLAKGANQSPNATRQCISAITTPF